MSSDFDEIFGDLKEDQHVTPSLTGDFDADSIFGDPAPSQMTEEPTKSPIPAVSTSTAPAPTAPVSDESPGGQDDFLSWLDDGPKAASPAPAPIQAAVMSPLHKVKATGVKAGDPFSVDDDDDHSPAPVASMPEQLMDESLREQGTIYDHGPLEPASTEVMPIESVSKEPMSAMEPPVMETDTFEDISLEPGKLQCDRPIEAGRMDSVSLDPSLMEPMGFATVSLDDSIPPTAQTIEEIYDPAVAILRVETPDVDPMMLEAVAAAALANGEVSLDDDDDDDFLEKIVQSANRKQQGSSRETSSSSLAIKSQSHSQVQQSIGAFRLVDEYHICF